MRIIKTVEYTGDGFNYCFSVGNDGVTLIKSAIKNGEMAEIIYYEIWKGDKLFADIHKFSLVVYGDEK